MSLPTPETRERTPYEQKRRPGDHGLVDGPVSRSVTVEPATGLAAWSEPAPRAAWWRSAVHLPLGAHVMPALDGVRAVAASLVFIVHFQAAFGALLGPPTSTWQRIGTYAALVGYHGVTVFFVLSGFLIYQSTVGRPTPVTRFVRRRIRRIYPTFLAVLAVYLALGALFPPLDRLPAHGALAYTVQNALLLPGLFPIEPIITVSWSLTYEICYYLGIAAVVGLLALRRWPWKARVLLVGALFVAAVATPGLSPRTRTFALFAPGILLYELTRSAPAATRPDVGTKTWTWPRMPAWLVAGAFLAAIVAAPAITTAFARSHVHMRALASAAVTIPMLSVGITLLLYEGTTRPGTMAALLARRPLRVLGVISYSFYLIHGLAIKAAAIAFWRLVGASAVAWGGPALYVALLVPVYAICVVAALGLFKLVEERFSL